MFFEVHLVCLLKRWPQTQQITVQIQLDYVCESACETENANRYKVLIIKK